MEKLILMGNQLTKVLLDSQILKQDVEGLDPEVCQLLVKIIDKIKDNLVKYLEKTHLKIKNDRSTQTFMMSDQTDSVNSINKEERSKSDDSFKSVLHISSDSVQTLNLDNESFSPRRDPLYDSLILEENSQNQNPNLEGYFYNVGKQQVQSQQQDSPIRSQLNFNSQSTPIKNQVNISSQINLPQISIGGSNRLQISQQQHRYDTIQCRQDKCYLQYKGFNSYQQERGKEFVENNIMLEPNGRAKYGIFVKMAQYVGNTDNKKCGYFYHKYLKLQRY